MKHVEQGPVVQEYNQLLGELKRHKFSASFVARTLNVAPGTISRRRSGHTNITVEALAALRWVVTQSLKEREGI